MNDVFTKSNTDTVLSLQITSPYAHVLIGLFRPHITLSYVIFCSIFVEGNNLGVFSLPLLPKTQRFCTNCSKQKWEKSRPNFPSWCLYMYISRAKTFAFLDIVQLFLLLAYVNSDYTTPIHSTLIRTSSTFFGVILLGIFIEKLVTHRATVVLLLQYCF